MQAELAGKALEHGRHIFVYNNLRSNQVVYSLSRSIANHDSLKQIPFNGKKSVPASIRPDAWQPLATVTFPDGYQGETAYQKLREYAKRHQLEWRQGEDEGQIKKRARGFELMNQKANSIADIAKVLKTQEAEIETANEEMARARQEDEAAFEVETARAEELQQEIQHVRQEIKDIRRRMREPLDDSVDREPQAALDSRIDNMKKEFESRLAEVDSWRVLVARIQELLNDHAQRRRTNRLSTKELQSRLEDLVKEQKRLDAGRALGVCGAAVRQANSKAYAAEKDQISQLTSQLRSFHTAKKLRLLELESELYVARTIQDTPKAAETYEEHKNYISNLEAVRDALRTPKEQRKEGWQTIAKDLGLDETPLNDVQRRLDTAKAQLILTPQVIQQRIKALSGAPVKVPRKLKAALRKLLIPHAKGVEGAVLRQQVRVAASENNLTDPQERNEGEGSHDTFRTGLRRVISQNRGDPDGDGPSMEGVKINWANVLDAELAETWPDAVVHDTIGLVKHVAPPPTAPIIRNLADIGNFEFMAIPEKVRTFEENLMKLEQLRGKPGEVLPIGEEVAPAEDAGLSESGEHQLHEEQAPPAIDEVLAGAGEVQSQGQDAAPALADIRAAKAQLRGLMEEALLVQAWHQAEMKALARQGKLRAELPLIEQSESLGPNLQPGMLERLKEEVLHPQVKVEMTLVDQHLKKWIQKPRIKAWLVNLSRTWEEALSEAKEQRNSKKRKKRNEVATDARLLKLATKKFDARWRKQIPEVKKWLAGHLRWNPVQLVSGPLPIDHLKEARDYLARLRHDIRTDMWTDEQKEELKPIIEQLRAAVKREMQRLTAQAKHTRSEDVASSETGEQAKQIPLQGVQ